jgi:hypothetical protein
MAFYTPTLSELQAWQLSGMKSLRRGESGQQSVTRVASATALILLMLASCPRCEAACNGPYDGKWSKTMIGYGDEDTQFVLELTYNYGKQLSLGQCISQTAG